MSYNFDTQAGLISLKILKKDRPLEDILTFACRENPKRSFMLVSKVLGRYVPTKPRVMRELYDELASAIGCGPQSYVISLAEAATGLGAGVADSLHKKQVPSVYFQHTTRHKLNRKLWFSIEEEHSHAVNHMFYEPKKQVLSGIVQSKRLVVIDDEITTGRTIKLLITKLLKHLPEVEEIMIVSLVNLMSKEKSLSLADFGIPITYISLLDAEIHIDKKPNFTPELPANVDADLCESPSSEYLGRCGMHMPYVGELPPIESSAQMTIIANGEHQYLPFLIAESHEKNGSDVLYQSINRSPLLVGESITNKISFSFDGRELEHYLYNFYENNRDVYVILENENERCKHDFAKKYPLNRSSRV